MAKQLVNPIERHVEKAVLGVTGLLLLGVVATYLFSTPNKMEFGQETVTPKTADSKVAQKADDVLASIRNRKPPEPQPVSKPEFNTAIALAELPAATRFLPMVPVVDSTFRTGGAGLAQVVQLPAPELNYGRTTIELPPDWPRYAELQGRDVTDWVTIAQIFDISEMSNRLASEYGGTRRKVIHAGVELQRRVQKEDGSWSESDWIDIEPWPAFSPPPVPPVPLFEEDGKVLIKSIDHQQILKFAEELETPATRQMEILRPLMRKWVNGDCWTFPLIKPLKERDVLLMDDEFRNPNQAQPSTNLDNRYPCLAVDSRTAEITNAKKLSNLAEQLRTAKDNCQGDAAKQVLTDATTIESDSSATGADKTTARSLMTQARQLIDDITFNRCRKNTKAESAAGGKREPLPKQLLWAIDGKPGSLTPGKSYQFRIRPVVYNPRTGEPDQFLKPHDAEVVLLRGEWSPPSETITIPPMTAYFVTSSAKERDSASVEIFTWFGGSWVKPKSSSRIERKVADWVKVEARALVPGPNGTTAEPNVTFDAQRMVADIDFDRPYRERQSSGKTGVKFGKAAATTSVLLVNDKGELEERFESLDKVRPDKKEIQNMVYKPDKDKP